MPTARRGAVQAEGPTTRLPDFLIIGAMKAGTTTLHKVLARHPALVMSRVKEPGYFSRPEVWARGRTWYATLFDEAGEDQLCAESSTCYSRWPHFGDVAGRIHEHLPGVKLIYIMRHPVERAYSHYSHNMRYGVSMGLEEAIEADPSIVDAGRYMTQIERYLQYFRREQMCFLTMDQLKDDPAGCLHTCQAFLGVEQHDLLASGAVAANRTGEKFAKHRLLTVLRRVRRAPGVALVADRCGPEARERLLWAVHHRLMGSFIGRRLADQHRHRLEPMTPSVRRRLLERFEPEMRRLEEFLGWDLSAWRE